ncbi:unnamed protein product [Sphenostylis stenocarpa]|uniref:Uncharacterized protein n=1 Tax=Sphenostylis stenocarpa TaxID=92480 RepID=A0AA86SQ50_9FABA|nr:unnamed protein product [Sphenostylis stenocarpa]
MKLGWVGKAKNVSLVLAWVKEEKISHTSLVLLCNEGLRFKNPKFWTLSIWKKTGIIFKLSVGAAVHNEEVNKVVEEKNIVALYRVDTLYASSRGMDVVGGNAGLVA